MNRLLTSKCWKVNEIDFAICHWATALHQKIDDDIEKESVGFVLMIMGVLIEQSFAVAMWETLCEYGECKHGSTDKNEHGNAFTLLVVCLLEIIGSNSCWLEILESELYLKLHEYDHIHW